MSLIEVINRPAQVALAEIWKYRLEGPESRIPMPEHAVILSVQMQDGQPTLWAIVDPTKPRRERKIWTVPTGVSLDRAGLTNFIGTYQNGWTVWHVFDLGYSQ